MWSITAKQQTNNIGKYPLQTPHKVFNPNGSCVLVAPCVLDQNIESNVETSGHNHVAVVRM